MEISDGKESMQYDCYPSWQGELCDNVPNYQFCHFVQKSPKQEKEDEKMKHSTNQGLVSIL